MIRSAPPTGGGEDTGAAAVSPEPAQPAQPARPSRTLRVLGIVGRVLVAGGVVLLLFTAYQVWGTTWSQEHTQATLRQELRAELHKAASLEQPKHRASGTSDLQSPPVDAATIAAPAQGKPIGVLVIPAIGVDQVIVEGTGEAELAKGPGHYTGTPLPGELGNVGIAGHRTTWGHPFWALNAIAPGDRIIVETIQGTFSYRAQAPYAVLPSNTSVLDATTNATITLTTCNPRFSASQRLVVHGVLTASRLSGSTLRYSSTNTASGHHGTDLAGASSSDWLPVLLWGLVVAAVAAAALVIAHQLRRRRWPVYVAAVPVLLVLLYFFFQSITPLLPASL